MPNNYPWRKNVEDIESPDTFDREYVKNLRAEAARYRTEAKELKSQLEDFKSLDAQIKTVRVENELTRRGLTADPSWVQIQEGQSPIEAVDNFLVKFPEFNKDITEKSVEHKSVPKAISPNPNTASKESVHPSGVLGTRGLGEIKHDPIARNNLRDLYRDLLTSSSNQKD